MRPRDQRIAFVIAGTGVVVCAWAIFGFFRSIIENQLGWTHVATAQRHYQAVGESYSSGFAVGFFLCFFLAIAAISISAWVQDRRARRRQPAMNPLPPVEAPAISQQS